jgi:tungstate transport system ATP-binding protein
MEFIYRLNNLTKLYNNKRVLQIESLDIKPAEIFVIVGPSGAGKSTLLRILNFLEKPSEGRLNYLGYELNSKDPPLSLRRQITMVFQQPILLSDTVFANVAYGLRIRKEQSIEARINEALIKVGMREYSRAQAHTLSGGEMQRVALARAMVIEPRVLLLDEPTANLDPYNVNLIEKIVKDMNTQSQMAIVMVTHNIFQAKRIADRVGLLLNGQLIETATNESFFNTPSDGRTVAFINGDMVY